MRVVGFLLLGFWAAAALAQTQTMYKCLDDSRRVTYSNVPCDKQGLKDGGAVADRTTTMPLGPLPKPAAKAPVSKDAKDARDGKDSKASRDETETMKRGAQLTPVVPLLEKLSK